MKLTLTSSNLKQLWYSKKRALLHVRFWSGAVYRYQNVPWDVVELILLSPSPGAEFHFLIVSHPAKYPYQRMR